MITPEDFFIKENEIEYVPDEKYALMNIFTDFLDSISQTTYHSFYVIDYYKKNFLYVSDNPLFLCGYSSNEVLKMGYGFYIVSPYKFKLQWERIIISL